MKHPSNANIPVKKTLIIGFVAMLLLTIAMVTMPASTVTVPAQSCFVDPTYPDPSVTNLNVSDTFTVDAKVNVTSPTSPGGTGMFGFEYKLFWNSTYINMTSYATHAPAGWEPPNGFLVKDETGNWSGGSKDGLSYHWYGYTCLNPSITPFTGVMSLCTYNFSVIDQPISPASDFNGTLDLADVKIVDNAAQMFITDVAPVAGTVQDGMYYVRAKAKPVADFTWSPGTPEVDELVTFNGSLSTPNGGSIESYAWNFSDGTDIVNETDPITTYAYNATGTYNVTLTVSDSEGLANSTTKPVTVVKASSTISISASPTTIEVGEDTTISGSITPTRVGVTVTIYYRLTGDTWNTLTTVPTNATSQYSYVWTPSALGTYEVNASWPGDANTNGSESSTITITVQDNTPPTIHDPSRTPSGDVQPAQDVKVSVNVTDTGTGVKNVTLSYTIDDGDSWTDIEMTYNSTSKLYNATIPGKPAFTTVKFNITAYDNAENPATRDGEDVNFVYTVVPEFPAALILPLFMIAALVAVILGKTAWSRKRKSSYVAK